jgi:hypothetical protein
MMQSISTFFLRNLSVALQKNQALAILGHLFKLNEDEKIQKQHHMSLFLVLTKFRR